MVCISVGASWLFPPPFFSSIFLYPFLTPPFRFVPCLSSHAASVLGVAAALDRPSPSTLAGCWTSLPPSALSLRLKYLFGGGFFCFCFVGLPKGAQRESKLPAAHACQMFGERSLKKERRGRRRGGGGCVGETKGNCDEDI